MEKTTKIEMKNIESVDVSNLLELTLSNINYSKERIIHYTFLIEEALAKWREKLQDSDQLQYIVNRSAKKVVFTFILKGEKCNPFNIEYNKDGESAPIEKIVDNLLSGIGTELRYKYKKGKNIITLTLPIAKDYEKKIFIRNMLLLMLPITIQQFFLTLASSTDSILLSFVDATQMSAVSLVTRFCNIPNMIALSISIAGVAIISQYLGKRDRKSVNQTAGILVKLAFFIGLFFLIISLFFPRFILSLYTKDESLIVEGAKCVRIMGFAIFLNLVERALFCFMQVVGDVKKSMVFSIITCISTTTFNSLFILGLFGVPKLGSMGSAVSGVISFTIQGILLLVYTLKNKQIRINLITKNKKLIKSILKYMVPVLLQHLSWVLMTNAVASAYGHKDSSIIAAYSVFTFIYSAFASSSESFRSCTALWIGKYLGKNQLEIAKIRATQSLKLVSIIALSILPLFILIGLSIHILPMDLTETELHLFDIMLISGGVNFIFGHINSTICTGILQTGGDVFGALFADLISFWGIIGAIALLCINEVISLPPEAMILILGSEEIISFPFKFFRYKQRKWLKSITKEIKI